MKFKIEVDIEDIVSTYEDENVQIQIKENLKKEIINRVANDIRDKIKLDDFRAYAESDTKKKIDKMIAGTTSTAEWWLKSDFASEIYQKLIPKMMPEIIKGVTGKVLNDVDFKDSIIKKVITGLK